MKRWQVGSWLIYHDWAQAQTFGIILHSYSERHCILIIEPMYVNIKHIHFFILICVFVFYSFSIAYFLFLGWLVFRYILLVQFSSLYLKYLFRIGKYLFKLDDPIWFYTTLYIMHTKNVLLFFLPKPPRLHVDNIR